MLALSHHFFFLSHPTPFGAPLVWDEGAGELSSRLHLSPLLFRGNSLFVMKMRIVPLLLLLLQLQSLLPATVSVHVAVASQAPKLQKVTLLGRNGARGLANFVDGKVTCDSCELTPVGKEMSIQLGEFLRLRYADKLNLSSRFDPTFVSFNAAQTERTIITGEGITVGMYPGALPLVKYGPMESDEVLAPTKSWPSWLMRDAWKKDLHLDDAWALKKLSKSDIETLSGFLPPNNGELCGTSPSLCALYVYDSWCVNISAGQVDPKLQPLLAPLEAISKRFLWRLYGVDPQNEANAAIGPLAGPFLRKMAALFASNESKLKLFVNLGTTPAIFAMLSSLGLFNAENTLADNSPPMLQFGDAIAFEYSTTPTQAYVQFYQFTRDAKGTNSNENYVAKLLSVQCTDEKGVVYSSNATANGCTLGDMLRHLSSLGVSDGQCYVTDTLLTEADCEGAAAPPAGSLCYTYRSRCPGRQCGPVHKAIPDPSRGFACQDAQLNKNTPYLAATIVSIGAPCVLAGAIIGFYTSDRIRRLLGMRKYFT